MSQIDADGDWAGTLMVSKKSKVRAEAVVSFGFPISIRKFKGIKEFEDVEGGKDARGFLNEGRVLTQKRQGEKVGETEDGKDVEGAGLFAKSCRLSVRDLTVAGSPGWG